MFEDIKIWIRGAGELGSAAACVLHNAGFPVFISELARPLAIRRTVTFSDAVFDGEFWVEEVKAVKCDTDSIDTIISIGNIPFLLDEPNKLTAIQPHIIVDARMLKHYVDSIVDEAPFTIGLGCGFKAGRNCHAVIETMRGHNLGRILWEGSAQTDTRIPGEIGGESARRVIYAGAEGAVEWRVDFGDIVGEGDIIGIIDRNHEIRAPFKGMVRGLISPNVRMAKGLKIADIDPRGEDVDYKSISDKARAVGRGVLEAVLVYLQQNDSDK